MDQACAGRHYVAHIERRPLDIIFVIDNSGSMSEEIASVERNINESFADIIAARQVDYRVIMVSAHGSHSGRRICVQEPLSGTSCSPIPAKPANTERFYHHSTGISSSNSLSRLLSTYGKPDKHGSGGWGEWLRDGSFKSFVEISDDNSNMRPEKFDAELLQKAPEHFGTAEERKYVFHSIVGLAKNNPPEEPWKPEDPVVTDRCAPGAVNVGRAYQDLSIMTGGLRFPICHHESYDAVFEKVAESVIDQVKLDCSIDAPDAPEGLEADLSKAVLEYLPGSGGELRQITRVDSYSQCSGDHFRVLAGHIELCPGVCHELENDDEGELWVHAKCRPPCTPTGPEVCEDRVDNDCDGLIDGYDEDCWR